MRQALELALEALEEAWYHVGTFQPTEKAIDLYDEARTAIKEALAQPEEEKLHPVHIGVDVTREGTAVTAFYRKPDAVMEMFYSQFHPMAQPERDYERGVIDGRQMQAQSSVDKAVNRMAQPEQEPVGRFAKFTDGIWRPVTDYSAGVPLYTTPPQRTWAGLTMQDVKVIEDNAPSIQMAIFMAEATLKDKNHGNS